MAKQKLITHRVSAAWRGDYTDTSFNGVSSTVSPGSLTAQRVGGVWNNVINLGENLFDWKGTLLRGENATTTLDGTVTRWITSEEGIGSSDWIFVPDSNPTGRYERRNVAFGGIYVPLSSLNPPLAVPTSSYSAEQLALARFNSKVAEVNRQFQGGVFFAELGKTLHGIAHPAEALFKGINTYFSEATKLRRKIIRDRATYLSSSRSRRKTISKTVTKAVTGLWLEKSFHWLPLMYDIQGAVSAFAALLDDTPSRFVKVSATVEATKTLTSGENSWGQGITFPYSETNRTGASVRMYGRVRVGVRDAVLPDLKALGFDIRSFVPTLWELVPYSWAVDYFTNIGDMIYGASYGGVDVEWSARGIKRFSQYGCTMSVSTRLMTPPAGWHNTVAYAVMKPSVIAIEKAAISRATYIGNYIPSFDVKVPGVGSLKWLNFGAAFLQRSLAFL